MTRDARRAAKFKQIRQFLDVLALEHLSGSGGKTLGDESDCISGANKLALRSICDLTCSLDNRNKKRMFLLCSYGGV